FSRSLATHSFPTRRSSDLIAMVFQSYALYPHMTVRENLAFGLKLRGQPAAVIEERVRNAAQLLGLSDMLDKLPKAMSGGQRQRRSEEHTSELQSRENLVCR